MKSIDFSTKPWRTTIGSFLIFIDCIWIWSNASLLYSYHYIDILHLFKYYDWSLILNIAFCILGISLAIYVIKGKITVSKGVMGNMALLVIGILIRELSINY